VLDVLDKYQPFLVPADRLYEAMNTVDPETGKTRGLIRVRVTTPANLPATVTRPDSHALMNPDRSVP
ncbi:MAG TPA: phytochelatin synthase family protein, partial [Saprospiraceae bacterium]|nr:phytochelatin synthase family protein [Saprospiraceae bacterium]